MIRITSGRSRRSCEGPRPAAYSRMHRHAFPMSTRRLLLALAALAAACAPATSGSGPAGAGAPAASPVSRSPGTTAGLSGDERATAEYLAAILDQPPRLAAFMRALPKGGDLHNHLSGASYAEHMLEWAAADGLCIERETRTAVQPPCDSPARPAAAAALTDELLRRQVIDAWSMRDFVPTSGNSGHDHFFDTFGRFGAADDPHRGDALALVMQEAGRENILYLERMVTPARGPALGAAAATAWTDDLAALRTRLLPVIRRAADSAMAELDSAEQIARRTLDCGTAEPDAGCTVEVRYLYQVLRGLQPKDVYAQLMLAFELVSRDPRVVGLNMVMPEDGYVAMRDFRLHMAMLDLLHQHHPEAQVTLHAGELVPGMVPPEGLRFHIRESIETGHARRIGHGVAVMHEDDPDALLRLMANRRILVEICLTSNATILGVTGSEHPLPVFLEEGVPVALATDDAGVSRSSLAREFE